MLKCVDCRFWLFCVSWAAPQRAGLRLAERWRRGGDLPPSFRLNTSDTHLVPAAQTVTWRSNCNLITGVETGNRLWVILSVSDSVAFWRESDSTPFFVAGFHRAPPPRSTWPFWFFLTSQSEGSSPPCAHTVDVLENPSPSGSSFFFLPLTFLLTTRQKTTRYKHLLWRKRQKSDSLTFIDDLLTFLKAGWRPLMWREDSRKWKQIRGFNSICSNK